VLVFGCLIPAPVVRLIVLLGYELMKLAPELAKLAEIERDAV
jgi:hypothetical protein